MLLAPLTATDRAKKGTGRPFSALRCARCSHIQAATLSEVDSHKLLRNEPADRTFTGMFWHCIGNYVPLISLI